MTKDFTVSVWCWIKDNHRLLSFIILLIWTLIGPVPRVWAEYDAYRKARTEKEAKKRFYSAFQMLGNFAALGALMAGVAENGYITHLLGAVAKIVGFAGDIAAKKVDEVVRADFTAAPPPTSFEAGGRNVLGGVKKYGMDFDAYNQKHGFTSSSSTSPPLCSLVNHDKCDHPPLNHPLPSLQIQQLQETMAALVEAQDDSLDISPPVSLTTGCIAALNKEFADDEKHTQSSFSPWVKIGIGAVVATLVVALVKPYVAGALARAQDTVDAQDAELQKKKALYVRKLHRALRTEGGGKFTARSAAQKIAGALQRASARKVFRKKKGLKGTKFFIQYSGSAPDLYREDEWDEVRPDSLENYLDMVEALNVWDDPEMHYWENDSEDDDFEYELDDDERLAQEIEDEMFRRMDANINPFGGERRAAHSKIKHNKELSLRCRHRCGLGSCTYFSPLLCKSDVCQHCAPCQWLSFSLPTPSEPIVVPTSAPAVPERVSKNPPRPAPPPPSKCPRCSSSITAQNALRSTSAVQKTARYTQSHVPVPVACAACQYTAGCPSCKMIPCTRSHNCPSCQKCWLVPCACKKKKDKRTEARVPGSNPIPLSSLEHIMPLYHDAELVHAGTCSAYGAYIVTSRHVAQAPANRVRTKDGFVALAPIEFTGVGDRVLRDADLAFFHKPQISGLKSFPLAVPTAGIHVRILRFSDSDIMHDSTFAKTNVVTVESVLCFDAQEGMWYYPEASTINGVSGSPVVDPNCRVVGWHSGNLNGRNYMSPVTQQVMVFLTQGHCDWEQVLAPLPNNLNFTLREQKFVSWGGSSTFLDDCGDKPDVLYRVKHHFPLRSALSLDGRVDDLIYEVHKDPGDFLPAVPTYGTVRKGLAKYFPKRKALPESSPAWEKAWDAMEYIYGTTIDGGRVLSHEEYLLAYTKHTSSSPCFPDLNKEKFMLKYEADLLRYWEELSLCTHGHTSYGLYIKSEILPREKVEADKARAFCADDQFGNYVGVRLFKNQLDRLHTFKNTPQWPGRTEFFGGWNQLYRRASKFGKWSGKDGHNWDGSVHATFFWRLANLFYKRLAYEEQTTSNFLRCMNYAYHCAHGVIVLPDGCVVRKNGAMSSGLFVTLDWNGIVSNFVDAYAFFSRFPDASLRNYREFVFAVFCGDDNFTSHDLDWSVAQFCASAAELGFEMTVEFEGVENATFCSKSFVDCFCGCGMKMPLLSMPKMWASLRYSERPGDLRYAYERACGIAIAMFPSPNDWHAINCYLDALESRAQIGAADPLKAFRLTTRSLMYLYHGLEVGAPTQDFDFQTVSYLLKLFEPVIDVVSFKELQCRMPRNATKTAAAAQVLQEAAAIEKRRARNQRRRAKRKQLNGDAKLVPRAMPMPNNPAAVAMRGAQRRRNYQVSRPLALVNRNFAGEYGRKVQVRLGINDQACFDYVRSLIDPPSGPARIPTSFGRGTCVFTSETFFDVPCVDLTGTNPDSGRYSAIIQPILGSLDMVNHYKVAIASGGVGCPAYSATDWTDPFTYVSFSRGIDPRLDRHYNVMTQNGAALYVSELTNTGSVIPINGGPLGNPDPVSSYPQGTLNISYGLTFTMSNDTVNHLNTVFPPPGAYMFVMHQESPGNPYTSAAVMTVSPNSSFTFISNTVGSEGGDGSSTDGALDCMAIVIIVPQSNKTPGYFTISNPDQATIDSAFVRWSLVPIFPNQYLTPMDYGIVKQIRPVSMSVVFTPTQPPAFSGGTASIAVIPGAARDDYFTNNIINEIGSLHLYESLSTLEDKAERNYNEGSSAIWLPDGPEDIDWRSPSGSLDVSYPTVVIAGRYLPSQPLTAQPSSIGNLKIVTNYEFTTESKLFRHEEVMGSQACVDAVLDQLTHVDSCRGNPEHFAWLKKTFPRLAKAFGTAYNFYNDNKGVINPALALGASLL